MTEDTWIKDLLGIEKEEMNLSEKQIKIVEAAIEVFSEKGYAATSTSEIAKKAGVAEGTVFKRFKTKKELFMFIVAPTMSKIVAPFVAKDFVKRVFQDDHASFEGFLRVLIKDRFEFVKNHGTVIKIFLQEFAFHPELQEEYRKTFTTHIQGKVTKVIDEFKAKGEIKAYPTETIIRLTISTIIGFLLTRFLILPTKAWEDELEINYTIEFILYGLKKEK